jgi:hypothetical protein
MAGLDNDVYKCERDEFTLTTAGQYVQVADGTNTLRHIISDGSPEGVHAADIGSFALDATNGASYIKRTDTANTGWEQILDNRTAWIPVNNGAVYNLGFAYSAGTFTLQGASGSLSASNPAYALLQDKTNLTQYNLYTITADQSFIDDAGASEIIGNLFGLTTGRAFAANRPFFVYLVANDDQDTLQAMISDNPAAIRSPAAANIGAPDDAVADAQGDFWSFDNIDETLYDENPCLSIGVIRMQMSTSDDWTITTLSEQDGVGRYQETTQWTYVRGHGGAASGTHVISNAGTEPTSATDDIRYQIDRHGNVNAWMNFTVNNTPSGAQPVFFAMPYKENQTGGGLTKNFPNALWNDSAVRKLATCNIDLDTQTIGNFVLDNGSTFLTNASFVAGDAVRVWYNLTPFKNM